MNIQIQIQKLKDDITKMEENIEKGVFYGRKSDYACELSQTKWALYKLENPDWTYDD